MITQVVFLEAIDVSLSEWLELATDERSRRRDECPMCTQWRAFPVKPRWLWRAASGKEYTPVVLRRCEGGSLFRLTGLNGVVVVREFQPLPCHVLIALANFGRAGSLHLFLAFDGELTKVLGR